jgi:GNAT superfamily N-acetyltransferase
VASFTVGGVFVIEPRSYDSDPDVAKLVAELQAEYVELYGSPDQTQIEPGEFEYPRGLFLVGLLDGDPVVSGGWRRVDGDVKTGEIKRMYVAARARRRGFSRLMLAELEATLARAGHERAVLMTGMAQPAAIALYESSGYEPAASYGIYACEPNARFYRKLLRVGATTGPMPG